jgi:hypothetical protein
MFDTIQLGFKSIRTMQRLLPHGERELSDAKSLVKGMGGSIAMGVNWGGEHADLTFLA